MLFLDVGKERVDCGVVVAVVSVLVVCIDADFHPHRRLRQDSCSFLKVKIPAHF